MALPVTDQLITQMMTENVRTQPTTPMEGNVSRPMIVADLLSAMRDVNFSQLMEQYGNIAGSPSKKSTPMTQGLMKEQSPHADIYTNCRLETSTISSGQGKNMGTVEVVAYATAITYGQAIAAEVVETDEVRPETT